MQPIKLKLTNFLSFRELEYDFEEGPVLLVGENRSDEGQESNGSGKTAIQSAIEKCWLDYTSRKNVRDIDLIRRGQKESVIESWIYCPVRDQVLHIKRVLTRKGNKLELYINDEPIQFATVNDGNNRIIEWIGITKEDLSNYYIVNKERFASFFSSSNSQKLQLMARFSNVGFLDDIDNDIKVGISTKEHERSSILEKKSFIQGKISVFEERINECSLEKFEKAKEEAISKYRDEIDNYENSIESSKNTINHLSTENEDIKRELVSVNKKLKEYTDSLSRKVDEHSLINKKISEIEAGLKGYREREVELNSAVKDAVDTEREIEMALGEINKKLAGIITCPKCGHRFLVDEDSDVDEEESKKVEILSLKKEIGKSIQSLRNDLSRLEDESRESTNSLKSEREIEISFSRELSSLRKNIIQIEEDIDKNQSMIENNNRRIKLEEKSILDSKNEITKWEECIKKMSEKDPGDSWEEEITRRRTDLYEAQVTLKDINDLLKAVESEIENMRVWLIQYKEFRMYLANISIKEMQYNCNEMLKDMGSDLRVSIDGFKRKADGTIKEEITPTIIRDEALPFNSFSGGERGRLEYAMILAQQKMINHSSKHNGLNFLFTDEIAEGIDALGLKSLVKSLNQFSFPMMITTHVVNQAVGSKVLKVIKENDISRIE